MLVFTMSSCRPEQKCRPKTSQRFGAVVIGEASQTMRLPSLYHFMPKKLESRLSLRRGRQMTPAFTQEVVGHGDRATSLDEWGEASKGWHDADRTRCNSFTKIPDKLDSVTMPTEPDTIAHDTRKAREWCSQDQRSRPRAQDSRT